MLLALLLSQFVEIKTDSYYQVTVGKRINYYFTKSQENLAYETFWHYSYHGEKIESVTIAVLLDKTLA